MSREIRRVPKDWQHPQEDRPNYMTGRMEKRYQPMFDEPFAPAMREWYERWQAWERGERPEYFDAVDSGHMTFWEYEGGPPRPESYRPDWPEATRTHLMMYETTSEGTPKSPAFETPEEVARWCADNRVSAFGDQTASYEAWLAIAKGGWAPSAVMADGEMMSGAEFLAREATP